MKRPDWMKEELNKKEIDNILIGLNTFVTDGTVQKIYEYIRWLEKMNSEDNSFCDNYKESDCVIDGNDPTCEMVRVYLQAKTKRNK